ncbi:MAG: hypothetical protein AABX98_01615 [Nanoarchaeota archaeon]
METEKPQSPNWGRYKDNIGDIPGFPFNEGFPPGGPFGNGEKTYQILLRDGERVEARIDYSTQYRTEGIRWETNTGKCIDRFVVAGWKEL